MRSFYCGTLVLALVSQLFPFNLSREIDLCGEWVFEIGDNLDYAGIDYNDSRWEHILVPGAWENEGFPGFDGYGWYRIVFTVPKHLKNKVLYLNLGQIDDVDRTYFNGVYIGGNGDFPPTYQTAYDVTRLYELPTDLIRFGKENTLAVRIYDHQGMGGIVHGEIGVFSRQDVIDLKIDLSGAWRFKTGDRSEWAAQDYDDAEWKVIAVPGFW